MSGALNSELCWAGLLPLQRFEGLCPWAHPRWATRTDGLPYPSCGIDGSKTVGLQALTHTSKTAGPRHQPVLSLPSWCHVRQELGHLPTCTMSTPLTHGPVPMSREGTTGLWSCRSQPPPSQPFMLVSVDISRASDKCRLRPTFKTQPALLFMWFLLTQRGAWGGAPELSGGGKPHPTRCHNLGPGSCLCGQERLGTGRAQPSSPAGIPHLALSNTVQDAGDSQQPYGSMTRSSGFICFQQLTSQVPTSHPHYVGLLLCPPCPRVMEGSCQMGRCLVCLAVTLGQVQHWALPCSRFCCTVPLHPAEQLWGMQEKDEEINCVINVCRIKSNYL